MSTPPVVARELPRASARERAALAVLLALAALLYARDLGTPSLEFDEGVYLSSADLLARGLGAGRDVFTSQPPLFFHLLDAGHALVGGSATGLRALAVLLALGATLAGWAIALRAAASAPAPSPRGRRLAARPAGGLHAAAAGRSAGLGAGGGARLAGAPARPARPLDRAE
ncbi:MAG: hypothetical protein H0V81_00235, partial [Solirubrobacterales bacterium]|nr:hypothetical protein [Solirubrobacterales bacterium]